MPCYTSFQFPSPLGTYILHIHGYLEIYKPSHCFYRLLLIMKWCDSMVISHSGLTWLSRWHIYCYYLMLSLPQWKPWRPRWAISHPESPAYPFRWQHELLMCVPVQLHLRPPGWMPHLMTYTLKMKDDEDKSALNKYKSKICWIIYLFTHKYGFLFLLTTSNSVRRRPVHSSYFANLHHKEILHNFLLFHIFSFYSHAVHRE